MRNTIKPNFQNLIIKMVFWMCFYKGFFGSKELRHFSKLIFVLSHGQSFIEKGFSANKQLVDTNMIRIVYDKKTSDNISIRSFVFTPELQKICMLTSQCYKEELKKKIEDKVRSEQSLKRKAKYEELENVKRRKEDLQNTINAL